MILIGNTSQALRPAHFMTAAHDNGAAWGGESFSRHDPSFLVAWRYVRYCNHHNNNRWISRLGPDFVASIFPEGVGPDATTLCAEGYFIKTEDGFLVHHDFVSLMYAHSPRGIVFSAKRSDVDLSDIGRVMSFLRERVFRGGDAHTRRFLAVVLGMIKEGSQERPTFSNREMQQMCQSEGLLRGCLDRARYFGMLSVNGGGRIVPQGLLGAAYVASPKSRKKAGGKRKKRSLC